MILADYLSRNHHDDEDPAELIPVSFCKIVDIDEFCVANRALVKASGETVPEVHRMDKELDPHITPEQQYVSKEQTPKGARPKILKTPVRESACNVQLEKEKDPVRMPGSHDKTNRDSPRTYEKIPHKSPKVRLITAQDIPCKDPAKRG